MIPQDSKSNILYHSWVNLRLKWPLKQVLTVVKCHYTPTAAVACARESTVGISRIAPGKLRLRDPNEGWFGKEMDI